MPQLIDIFGFISVLLRGLTLAGEALTVGGVIFLCTVLPQTAGHIVPRPLLMWSAALLAVTQACFLAVNSAILVGSTDMAWANLYGATFWIAGCLVVLGALAVIGSLNAARPFPITAATAGIACALILSGSVMASHSVSRIEHRALLVALTFAHHVAGAAWIGGMPYLVLSLRRTTQASTATAIAGRFSRLAIACLVVLACAGLGLSWYYVASRAALTGTIYGIMLLAKVTLTLIVLFVGGLNFKIARASPKDLTAWLPLQRFAEVEAGIGFTILLAAASLTSTPPAIDIQTGMVTTTEIGQRIRPRWPRLRTPAVGELSPATSLQVASFGQVGGGSFIPGESRVADTQADTAWSEYNHNLAGLVVLAIGVASVLAGRYRWAQNWPVLFLGLAIFLLVRADSENWPLGPRGFWESFQVAEVAQHRLFVLLIILFAVFEWAVQTKRLAAQRAGLVFPLVCAVSGALLLTHSHSLINATEEFLAEFSHLPIAILAIVAGWSRWLEIRLPRERLRAVAWVWPVCLVLIGALLVNYRES